MKFKIYQLKDMRGTDYGFMGWDFAKDHGFKISDYDEVYAGERNPRGILENLFEEFNVNCPDDFKGHSLSVSDVVAIETDHWHYYYCDRFGWEDITEVVNVKPKKKYRVWARCIDYVYIDIEAESEEDAREAADELDGGDFRDDGMGDWEFGSVAELDDDAEVDYTYDEIVNPE